MSTEKKEVDKLIQDDKKNSGWKSWLPSLFIPSLSLKGYKDIPNKEPSDKKSSSDAQSSSSYGSFSS